MSDSDFASDAAVEGAEAGTRGFRSASPETHAAAGGGASAEDGAAFDEFAVRLRRGDDAATRELLSRFSVRLAALARERLGGRLGMRGDADDVVQSVMRTFFRQVGEGQLELRDWASLSGLLSLLTLRKCQRQAARHTAARRDVRIEVSLDGGDGRMDVVVPDREPTPDEVAVFNDLLEWLLDGLADRDRRAVELIAAGTGLAETAESLRCSRRTVQRTLARVRQRLLKRPQ